MEFIIKIRITIFVTKLDSGGAFLAVKRLIDGLDTSIYEIKVITKKNSRKEIFYYFKKILESFYRRYGLKKNSHISLSLAGLSERYLKDILDKTDIILLTWVNDGLLNIRNLDQIIKTNKKIFWRLSDMWPITGGCHYSGDCINFKSECRECPQENIIFQKIGLTKYFQLKKSKIFNKENAINLLAPSKWMINQVNDSHIFAQQEVNCFQIGTSADTKIFFKKDLKKSKNKFEIDYQDFVIGVGAKGIFSDKRKGFDLFLEMINSIKGDQEKKIHVLIFGEETKKPTFVEHRVTILGEINQNDLSHVYNACDLFVSTTRFENLANTLIEANMCGCPVLAFGVGGYNDVIENGKNGYNIEPFDIDYMAKLIKESLFLYEFNREAIAKDTKSHYSVEYRSKILEGILKVNDCE
ncbi:glycosyltransferase [Amylibacter sp.]|nr:glycosyltransferase [Amylibacter sp.]